MPGDATAPARSGTAWPACPRRHPPAADVKTMPATVSTAAGATSFRRLSARTRRPYASPAPAASSSRSDPRPPRRDDAGASRAGYGLAHVALGPDRRRPGAGAGRVPGHPREPRGDHRRRRGEGRARRRRPRSPPGARCGADGHPDARARRHRRRQAYPRRGGGPRRRRPHAHDVRPRRVRLRGAAGRRQRLPAQGRPPGGPDRGRADRRGRGRADRAGHHQAADRAVRPHRTAEPALPRCSRT